MSLSKKCMLFAFMGFLMISQNKLSAQSEPETEADIFTAKNSVHAELLGNSGLYGLHYGRIFHQKDKLKLVASLGFSLQFQREIQPIHSSYVIPIFPVEVTAFWGRSRHHLEVGSGYTAALNRRFIFDENYPNNIREQVYLNQALVPRIGYRYQKPEGGFLFRVGYTPIIGISSSNSSENIFNIFPYWFGISLGYSF
ncbi:hypothetical protein SAMN04488057_12177 [Cyclobacterium lianum]|uniref:Outer membrane protein beta-barrel domain-containing protein n=1 Tax=Cyclobacterium lianum TaxID=388280 RepID=A0A1M7QQR8_9BACT|nr:hypothetical protein SAMN04488057_12177 [Cyclobacterium lianum]